MPKAISIVALGNSNNLSWSILFSLAKNHNARCSLIMLNKGKLRDCPPLLEPLISITTLSALPDAAQLLRPDTATRADLLAANILLVSGEFFALVPELREQIRKSCVLIAVPIGFDIEILMCQFLKSEDSRQVAYAERMRKGLAACDWAAQNDNTSEIAKRELTVAGLWNRRLPIWRDLNPIRLTLSRALVLNSPKYNPAIGPVSIPTDVSQFAGKSIFVASRVAADNPDSLSSKGSSQLFDWLVDHSNWLASKRVGVLVINRDDLSKNFIHRLRAKTQNTGLHIGFVPELNYVAFLKLLAASLIAVDSFDLENQLRPHMTTSDALSVGTPIVTSLGRTNRGISVLTDPAVKITLARQARLLLEGLLSHPAVDSEEKTARAQRHLEKNHRELTDLMEADSIINLATD